MTAVTATDPYESQLVSTSCAVKRRTLSVIAPATPQDEVQREAKNGGVEKKFQFFLFRVDLYSGFVYSILIL